MTSFNLNPLVSHKTCLVCGKSFESYHAYDFLCSESCKEIYFNQGGILPNHSELPKPTVQASTGLLAIYALGLLSSPSESVSSTSSRSITHIRAEGTTRPLEETPITTDLLKGKDSPYQNPICLNPPQSEWVSKSHQKGFILNNHSAHLMAKVAGQSNYLPVSNGDVSSLVKDDKSPILQTFKISIDSNSRNLTVDWLFEDPLQQTVLNLKTENTCQEVTEETLTINHSSDLKQIELTLDGSKMVLNPTQKTYQYTNLSYGTHTLTLKAYDQAGNLSNVQTETFVIEQPVEINVLPPVSLQVGTSQSSTPKPVQKPNQTLVQTQSNQSLNHSNSTQTVTQDSTKPSSGNQTNTESSSTSNPSLETNTEEKPVQSETTTENTNSQTIQNSNPTVSTPPPAEKPSLSLPSDTKGSILTRISTRHSSISESDYHRILLGAYNITPTFVLQAIENKGFDIVLTGNNIRELVRAETGWDAGWNYSGVTFPNYNGYVRIWSSLKGDSNILVHEIAHAYDYAVGRPSRSDEFKALYGSEVSKLFPEGGLYASSSEEYYAESFRMYLNERSKVKSKAPQTAAYFKGVFGF